MPSFLNLLFCSGVGVEHSGHVDVMLPLSRVYLEEAHMLSLHHTTSSNLNEF